jgi:hypothetical protein
MATLKNPSIYDDRGTIGSADELDEYGVWVKIEPEELSDADVDSFPDFDAVFGQELSLDESPEDDTAFDDFAFSVGGEDSGFDDVEALRQDIESLPPTEPASDAPSEQAANKSVAAPAASGTGSVDLSTQLLMKIVDELSSISDQLSTLKGELSTIRSENPAGGSAEDAGFFDEEDDDKIALTGDELNNIIHTADFTEETGFDEGASLADDFAGPDTLEPDVSAPSEAQAQPSGDGAEIIHDGLGRPLRAASSKNGGNDEPSPAASTAAVPAEANFDAAGAEIIYDGLGRPLNRKISEDDGIDTSPAFEGHEDLKMLQENGVEPMTPAPEDTSYLEDDPLAEESIDLSDAVIEEPDLSEGLKDTPLEEPSLDNLSLIDLENMEDSGEPPAQDEATVEEKPFFEDITFDDLSDPDPLGPESMADLANLDEGETIDLSIFEDDFLMEDGAADPENADELSFEVLDEDADLPVQGNVQDNVITEDSFESISLDDDGEIDEVTIDEDLEQALPEGMKIELDIPPLIAQDRETEDDKNFDRPGSVDAGDLTISIEEVSPAVKMDLRDVLIYMDKLLESLPEEKINEFAQSEHYNTYKKLFEELGIQQ